MWLDQHEVSATVDPSVQDSEIRKHLQDLLTQGFAHLPGAVPRAVCDELVADFERYCSSHPESADFADEHGHHSRLGNFHLRSEVALSVGFNPRVLAVLDAAFGQRASICSSLVFEKGSQQIIHRDTLFFHTDPPNQFFGVWTALEDVRPDAGPLAYFIGGHRFQIDRLQIARSLTGKSPAEMVNAFLGELHQRCKAEGFPFGHADFMQKGDVLIWHPQLPHGGSPIAHPGLTRRSMVFHYMPEGRAVHGVEVFFSDTYPDSSNLLVPVCGRMMIDHGAPIFERNY